MSLSCLFHFIMHQFSDIFKGSYTDCTSHLHPRVAAAAAAAPLAVPRPPDEWDHAAFRPASVAFCAAQHPGLLDLAEDGTLVVVPRAPGYSERRSDGYLEPELVYLVGTSHISAASAEAAARVVRAVRPQ